MKNRKLAEEFVNGATKGKGSHMFIDGNILYSYGAHFPLAIRFNLNERFVFVVNSDKYSMSTSRHQSSLRYALEGKSKIYKNTKQLNELSWKNTIDLKEVIAENLDNGT